MHDNSTASGTDSIAIESVPQHTVLKWIALHLLPAVPIMAFYMLAAPSVIRAGYPPVLALIIGFLLIGIPIELGTLLYLGRKLNGTYSLRGIVLLRDRMPIWQYALLFVLLLAFAFGVLFFISPYTQYLAENVFWWMPKYLLPDGSSPLPVFAPAAILFTLILGLILTG